jgi:hypothetical protein
MIQVKDEDKHLELVRWAVVRTKSGHKWLSPYPIGEILFVVETEEKAWKLLKEAYYDCLLMYPELRESDHYISEHGGFAFAGDPKVRGVELHTQRISMPLTDKEIVGTADYWYYNFRQPKPTEEEQDDAVLRDMAHCTGDDVEAHVEATNGGDKVRE